MLTKLLIIDDDVRLYALLEEYLSENNVLAAHACDGLAGLERLASDTFDAVFLDVMMPRLGGLETLRRIRDKSQVPVIMLTAKGDETDRVVGLELGADDYLPKPFSPRELLARLRAVLRRAMPSGDDDQVACAERILRQSMRRAYRRPINDQDMESPRWFFRQGLREGDPDHIEGRFVVPSAGFPLVFESRPETMKGRE